MRDTSGFVRQAEEYDLTAVWVAAGRDCQRCGKPLITARRAADLDEFRLDDDQDDYRADLGVLRACELVGSGSYPGTGSVRLVDP